MRVYTRGRKGKPVYRKAWKPPPKRKFIGTAATVVAATRRRQGWVT